MKGNSSGNSAADKLRKGSMGTLLDDKVIARDHRIHN